MTDLQGLEAERAARLAQLRDRRNGESSDVRGHSMAPRSDASSKHAPGRSRRRSPAAAAKIFTIGASTTAVLGIMAGYGIAEESAASDPVLLPPDQPFTSVLGAGQGTPPPASSATTTPQSIVVVVVDQNGRLISTSNPSVLTDPSLLASLPPRTSSSASTTVVPESLPPSDSGTAAPRASAAPVPVPAPATVDLAVPAPPPPPAPTPQAPAAQTPAAQAPAPQPAAPQPQAQSSGS